MKIAGCRVRSGEILGAAILGVGGDEVDSTDTPDVMYAKAPYTVIQRAVHIHPTVAELVPHDARGTASAGVR